MPHSDPSQPVLIPSSVVLIHSILFPVLPVLILTLLTLLTLIPRLMHALGAVSGA